MPSGKKEQSPLAAAQSLRGRDPSNRIGDEVMNRIVSNSSQQFQDYLASTAGQQAVANTAAMAIPVQAPAFQPMAYPVASSPAPPILAPQVGQPTDPRMQELLSYFGLI